MSESRKSKSRRSSILKPAKPRNPLSDVDLKTPTEITISRFSRRVSFASNNIIKEFTSDPEKNTIWHMSYEEEINKSDKSNTDSLEQNQQLNNLSVENLSFDSDEFNCTKIDIVDNTLEVLLANNSSENSITSANVELTSAGVCSQALNIPSDQPNVQEINCAAINFDFERDICHVKRQTILFNESEGIMEITQPVIREENSDILKTKRQTILYNQCPEKNIMELTQVVAENGINKTSQIKEKQQTTFKSNSEDCKIDLNQINTNIQTKNHKRQTIIFNQDAGDADMEETRAVLNEKEIMFFDKEYVSSERQSVYYTQMSDVEKMDMTELLPVDYILLNNQKQIVDSKQVYEKIKKTKRQIIHCNQTLDDGNMEMTEVLPAHFIPVDRKTKTSVQEIDKENKSKRQTINFNQISDNANMELTEVLPVYFVPNAQNMIDESDKENIKTKRQTIHYNQMSDDGNMEMTEVLPVRYVPINKKPRTDSQEIDKENKKSKRQTINFNQMSDDANMEMTEVLLPCFIPNTQNIMVDKGNNKNIKTKRQTVHYNQNSDDENMEMTEVLPAHFILRNDDAQEIVEENRRLKRQTINFNQMSDDANMEMTDVLPVHFITNDKNIIVNETDKENIITKRQTTEVSPTHFVIIERKHKNDIQEIDKENKSKRQTIHFNQTSNNANMEMTEVLPAHFITNVQNIKVNKTEKENMKTNRQTIHYNQILDNGNMEMTEILPGYCHPNIVQEFDKENNKSEWQTIHYNEISHDGNMEVTEVLPAGFILNNKKQNYNAQQTDNENNKSKRQTIIFNQEYGNIEETKIVSNKQAQTFSDKENVATKRQTAYYNKLSDDGNMEMTKITGTDDLGQELIHKYHVQKLTEENMEMTGVFPLCFASAKAQNLNKENLESKRQTLHFNQISDDGNMEITEVLPTHFISNIKMQNINAQEIDNENLNSKQQTIHYNQMSHDGNMELTEVLPAHFNPDNNTQTIDGSKIDKENIKLNRQTINFNQISNDANMEITEVLPGNFIPHIQDTNEENIISKQKTFYFNQMSNDENIEMAEVLPAHHNQNNKKQRIEYLETDKKNIKSKRQTIHFNQDGNMEMTEVLPANFISNVQNKCQENDRENVKSKQQTINFNQMSNDGNIEMTEVFPVNNKKHKIEYLKTDEENIKPKRETSHFNQMFEDGNMEMTEVLSAHLTQNKISMINNQEIDKENINSKRQTINYNQMANDDNIEIIETLQSSLNAKKNIKPYKVETLKKKVEINVEDKENCPISQNSMICDSKINKNENVGISSVVPLNSTGYFLSHRLLSNQLELKSFEINNAIKDSILKMTDTDLLTNESTNSMKIYLEKNKLDTSRNIDINNDISSKLPQSERLDEDNNPKNADLNKSNDICQRILLPGQKTSNEILVEKLELTPANHNFTSFNITKNLSSFVDSTEKLIGYKTPEIPISEYSKIINENVDVNSSDVQKEILSKSANIDYEMDSIITINSSAEINGCYNAIKNELSKICSDIKMPEKVDSDDEDDFGSLKKFIDKSFHAMETINSQNISLVDSFSSNNSSERNFAIITAEEILDKFGPKLKSTNENLCLFFDQKNEKKTTNLRTRFKEFWQKLIPAKEIRVLTLEDKIKKKICKDSLWSFINSDNEEFNFTYMNDTIKFVVFIDRATEIVKNVDFSFQINESKSRPVGIYTHNILINKLKASHIRSACGPDYSMLSLLDYLTIIGEQMLDIYYEFNDLELQHGMVLDRDFNATFQFRNYVLLITFEVSLNINNLENITEENVTVRSLIGKVDVKTVKQLVKGCPLGVPLLKAYVLSIKEYIKVLQHNKKC